MFKINCFTLKFAGAAVCFTALMLFFFPFRLGIKNIGNIFGISISFILFVYFAFNKLSSKLLTTLWQHNAGKISVICLISFLVAGFLSAAVISAFMVKSAYFSEPETAKPAILLGCKVNGEAPSLMLERRLRTATDYLNEFPDAFIIVSGGQGENEDISEAECMKRYLVSAGIDESRIIKEDKSENTDENIKYSKKLLDEINPDSDAVIITDSFHQLRTSIIARNYDLKVSAVSAQTPMYLLPTYWVREWFGILSCIKYRF